MELKDILIQVGVAVHIGSHQHHVGMGHWKGHKQAGLLLGSPAQLPSTLATKTSESSGGLRIKCKCAHVPRKPKTAIFTAYWGLARFQKPSAK